MHRMASLVVVSFLFMLSGVPACAQDCIFKTREDESLKQALKSFHDVLSELVHGPAEKGDFGPVRARAGELAKLRDGIMAAGLPARMVKRCAEISARATDLSKGVENLVAQTEANAIDAAIKTAFDTVHVAYRNLNGALTSLEDLLDAFHDLLHPLWHDAYPNKDAAAIKTATPRLKVRAKLILSSAQSTDKPKAPGAKNLLDAVTTLEEAVAAKDDLAILEALRMVHEAYEMLAGGHE
ncbi:MAG: hypothetical protein HXY20_03870 [Acidobacteria bacterium]|nr:hypothetical protein [Acidobacteriota bacterium]